MISAMTSNPVRCRGVFADESSLRGKLSHLLDGSKERVGAQAVRERHPSWVRSCSSCPRFHSVSLNRPAEISNCVRACQSAVTSAYLRVECSSSKQRKLTQARAWIAHQAVTLKIASLSHVARLLQRSESSLREAVQRYYPS